MRKHGWWVDLNAHVLPGLWDGHAHLLGYGEMLGNVKLYGVNSLEEANKRIDDYRRLHPGSGTRQNWIKGIGWDQSLLPTGMPTAADLPDNLYILLYRVDAHCLWVSAPVLALLPSSPIAIPGGTIPSPGVFCDNAMDLILPLLPPTTIAQKKHYILTAQKQLHTYGIVGLHDAGVLAEDRGLYFSLASRNKLSLRINAMIECHSRNTFCPLEASRITHPFLIVRSVKLFADGALGSWGAALLSPYSDNPTTSGTMLLSSPELTNVTTLWSNAGYQVCIHAIGDLANRLAIDAIAAAAPGTGKHRIEHAQIISPKDQARMKSLGIIPSIQPTHATSDSYYAAARLGAKRLRESAYRMKSLLNLHPVLGSDFPVEPPSVLAGIYAAVERRDPKVGGERWFPEEALTVRQALRGFTRAPAEAVGWEGVGKVEKGAWADWVVLDRRLDGEDKEWLRGEEAVRETWIVGKRVFRRGE
ncbi:amidohydrolase 3 [Trichophaea hybrida]|nr:amidohydrolase 3 [Trichophaea hybrida]